jgi:two-component system, NarL family, sensor histidine kinase YdfH
LVAELAAANRQISAYAQEVERLTLAQERQRMARELHDTLAQGVAGIVMQLEAANAHLSAGRYERAQTIVQESMNRARLTLAEARAAIDDLRVQDTPVGLRQWLATYARRFQADTGLICRWQLAWAGLENQLRAAQEETLTRIIIEAFSNSAQHAQATAVSADLRLDDATLILTLRDDGQGFNPHQPPQPGHYGLRGLRERVQLLNGTLTIDSAPGQGTTILATIPLDSIEKEAPL